MLISDLLDTLMDREAMSEVFLHIPDIVSGESDQSYEAQEVVTGYRTEDGVIHILPEEEVDSFVASENCDEVVIIRG